MNVTNRLIVSLLLRIIQIVSASFHKCPVALKFGDGPSTHCPQPFDPNNMPPSPIERWFTQDIFYDLFPKANLGWGPNSCFPYSYEAFIIAARYFPRFGNDQKGTNYTVEQNARRDLAAFFAHAVQETGENDVSLYNGRTKEEADDCFYRGGFYNWFEGGPVSSLLMSETKGSRPEDGTECNNAGRQVLMKTSTVSSIAISAAGPIQLSYNFNYGLFNNWLRTQNIHVDLLRHDIVVGNWRAGLKNQAANYSGAIFGPTSLIINNECHGEDKDEPGGGGENRRIKAFKWFCKYFGVPTGDDKTLSCKSMPEHFGSMNAKLSYQPDWTTTWKPGLKCKCSPALYSGMIPYYDPLFFPEEFLKLNAENELYCQRTIYDFPLMYSMDNKTSACLNTPL
ncbi:Endochitinase 1 [Aphelenchoides bicaudatus]|nr:Endochitinase 1 [Aphelenchoides bicaudatus]